MRDDLELRAWRSVLPMLTVAWVGSAFLLAPHDWMSLFPAAGLAIIFGPPALGWATWAAFRWRARHRSKRLWRLFMPRDPR